MRWLRDRTRRRIRSTGSRGSARVRRAAFARLLDGRSVTVSELATDCALAEHRVEDALTAMVTSGAATRDATGAVVAVSGLSVVPAAHELQLAGREFWTWCAFDAVGIPAALEVDAVARTRCGHCARPIELRMPEGQPPADSPLVGWLPGGPCANVQVDFCPAANLFCDSAHLTAWRAEAGHPPGGPASISELAEEGRAVWAEMRPCWLAAALVDECDAVTGA